MTRSAWFSALLVLVLFGATAGGALAQPSPLPLDGADAPPSPPPPAGDAPALLALYDSAFAALVAGDLATAIPGLETVARQSTSPETRAAAAALLRLAQTLAAREITFVTKAPGAPLVGAVSGKVDTVDDRDSGRTTFIVSTTLMSTYSGVVLLDILDVDDFRAGVVTIVGTTAVGFLGSLYGSRGRTITASMGDAYTLGLSLGLSNGLLLAFPLGLDDSSEKVESFALGAMAAGGAAGMLLADWAQPTRAQVNFVGTLAMLGVASTGLGLGITQPDSLDPDDFLLLMAAGLNLGTGVGMGMAPKLDWSLSRARLAGLGAFLGGLGGWAVAALATGAEGDDETAKVWSAATLAGMWAGFGLGTYFTRDMAPDQRFRTAEAASRRDLMVTPTRIRDAPGFAVTGQF